MRTSISISGEGLRWSISKRISLENVLISVHFALSTCAPAAPGDSFCVGDSCAICSGWDCYNSFINEKNHKPLSIASREAVTQCYEGIEESTRDLADGHFEPLARTGPLSWGPARLWGHEELKAWEMVVIGLKACMEQQGWVYCCRGYFCDYNFVQSGYGQWICLREPST